MSDFTANFPSWSLLSTGPIGELHTTLVSSLTLCLEETWIKFRRHISCLVISFRHNFTYSLSCASILSISNRHPLIRCRKTRRLSRTPVASSHSSTNMSFDHFGYHSYQRSPWSLHLFWLQAHLSLVIDDWSRWHWSCCSGTSIHFWFHVSFRWHCCLPLSSHYARREHPRLSCHYPLAHQAKSQERQGSPTRRFLASSSSQTTNFIHDRRGTRHKGWCIVDHLYRRVCSQVTVPMVFLRQSSQ